MVFDGDTLELTVEISCSTFLIMPAYLYVNKLQFCLLELLGLEKDNNPFETKKMICGLI